MLCSTVYLGQRHDTGDLQVAGIPCSRRLQLNGKVELLGGIDGRARIGGGQAGGADRAIAQLQKDFALWLCRTAAYTCTPNYRVFLPSTSNDHRPSGWWAEGRVYHRGQ